MHHLYIIITVTLCLSLIKAETKNFSQLNPPLTEEMKINRVNATLCSNPAVAKEEYTNSFHYGCFCGKGHPNIEHYSNKNYKDLNKTEKEELVAQYYSIKPYDSIDESCQKHDICYIYKGRKNQVCNDAIYRDLKELKKIFKEEESRDNPTSKQCKILTADIADVFKTIFWTGDDISMFRLSIFAMITPIIVANKGMKKSVEIINSDNRYPSKGVKCLIPPE